MHMKKHLIAAMAAAMILALAAPALAAANVGGYLDFGYTYDIDASAPDAETPANEWGLNVNGNISDSVSFKIGFENEQAVAGGQLPAPTEAWIQAEDTMVGNVKLGAFDLAFGHGNDAPWYDDTDPADPIAHPLNVQVENDLGGINLAAGVQFDETGKWNALGAAVSMEPMYGLLTKVGVMTTAGNDEIAFGYEAAYTGIDSLELGLKGNLKSKEMVANAGYEIMPGIKATALYGQDTENADETPCDSLIEVGAEAAFENGIHAGASYEMSEQSGVDHKIIRVNGGYDYELAEGLIVGLEADYVNDDQAAEAQTSFGVNAGIEF